MLSIDYLGLRSAREASLRPSILHDRTPVVEKTMWDVDAVRARLVDGMLGSVSSPGEPDYDRAISIWAKPRTLPRLVAHCRNVGDVQHSVRTARDAGMPISVRSGGHDWTGRALCAGLTIDMSGMNGVGSVTRDGVIEVEGGVRGSDVYAVTDPAGVAPVLGSVAEVGLAALVTGGGYGPLMRKYGLACDNLRAATLVLADGSVVRAAEDGDAELFWAIRGGGGNFGIVTSMELELRDVPTVRSGVLVFPFERAGGLLPQLERIWAEAPPELDVQFGIVPGPDGAHILYVSPTWCGGLEDADAALAPLYALEGRVMETVCDQRFGESRKFFDEHIVYGLTTSADNVWVREWNAEVSALVVDAVRARPNDQCFVLAHDCSGAATRVAEGETAFGLRRDHIWFEAIAPTPSDGGDGAAAAAWAGEVMASLAPYCYPGGYPNMLAAAQRDRIQHSYGDNAARLVAAKRRYDPDYIFTSAIPLPEVGGS